ncbi:MAG: DegT/DnrJ/EryC1/StrS family aminotransferase [Opitutaceae bacterium]|nr:DegT/DnrJ/EryC1/StrS family aminotransferase [Opitutaceae bacterium]
MNTSTINRRGFLAATAVAGVGAVLPRALGASGAKPAILGGKPVRTERWPKWPVYSETEDKLLLDVAHSGRWNRYGGKQVKAFETAFAARAGARHCVATNSGTSALFTCLGAMGIGPGDEVILPPFTFVATFNVITLHYALPIYVDVDPETSQIDANKIEAAITPNTKAIIPVQIGGNVADLDKICALSKKHDIPVIEDACQSHLAEWRGKMVGNWGLSGCFSFQLSKNLNCGDGGAIISNDADFAYRCESFQDQSRGKGPSNLTAGCRAGNLRMTEFQGAILNAQMTRLEEQSKHREENAAYLTSLLKEIPGIVTQKQYAGCTRQAWHVYAFRYKKDQFSGLSRERFMHALKMEGITDTAPGYTAWNKEKHVSQLAANRHYQRLYSKETLARWQKHRECPQNDLLCAENVRFTQTMLLGPRSDMEQIADAIRKIQRYAGEITPT